MDTFLGEVCEKILKSGYRPEKVALVLPTKRAGLFFKREFANQLIKPNWSPQILTINQLAENISGIYSADPLALNFELYPVYKKVFGEKAREFDEFLQWAGVIINDFSEIDAYLIEPEKLFRDLREIQDIENWSYNLGDLSENQKTYSDFWNKMAVLYSEFTLHLDKQNFSYSGRISKKASLSVVDFLQTTAFDQYFFAGFNALSRAENQLINKLKEAGKASVIWDYDDYYLNDEVNEAGLFLRKNKKQDPEEFAAEKKYYKSFAKSFEITGSQLLTQQAEIACASLAGLSENELTDTALVLADESLLMPVLNRLPDNVKKVNISMGLSLAEGVYFKLTESLFALQENYGNLGESNKFYYRDILSILENPAIAESFSKVFLHKEIAGKIRRENIIFADLQQLTALSANINEDDTKLLSRLFHYHSTSPLEFIENLIQCFQLLNKKSQNLNEEFLYREVVVLQMLYQKLKSYPEINITSLKTLKKIVLRALKNDTLSFIGEPLQGLQIMGMLETRALDFKKIIVLSANEGVLPASRRYDSFIPFDLKQFHHLPGKREREAIFAYHFYRLIQRARDVKLIYSSNREVDGGGEKSRFIAQLEYELPKYNPLSLFKYPIFEQALKSDDSAGFSVEKTNFVKEKIIALLEKGLSPSSINTFTSCPLDWYYKYILGMRDTDEVEEEIASSTLGSAVHDTLEEIYKPFKIGKITSEKLRATLVLLKPYLQNFFTKHHSSDGFRFGVNHISFEAALIMCQRYINQEADRIMELEKDNINWQLISLEEWLSAQINFKIEGQNINFKISGLADRIELINGSVKVSDYKTGKVSPAELRVKDINDLIRKPKALQLMAYAYCYHKMHNCNEVISSIIPLRNSNTSDLPLEVNAEFLLDSERFNEFESVIKTIVSDMLNIEIPFEHSADSKYCRWCE